MNMKVWNAASVLLAALVVGIFIAAMYGCATPQTFGERLLTGYNVTAEMRSQASTLLNLRRIGSADAENVQRQADIAREGLDIAKGMRSTQPQAAEDKLASTQAVISALKAYLLAKEASK
jgi:hypothetical protein